MVEWATFRHIDSGLYKMTSWINQNFDIDLWIKLASDNPYKFEVQRHQWMETTIAATKSGLKQRLNGILWEMNMDLQIAKNKLTNCRSIASRITHHLIEFKDILEGNLPFINKHPARVFHLIPKQDSQRDHLV